MNKNKIFMITGAIAIILFIIWFYFKQLSLPERVYQESTIAKQIENTGLSSSKEVKGTESELSRIDSQGAVAVQVAVLPEMSLENELMFEIVMNTHSVDLNQYQLNKLAQLSFGTTVNTTGEFEWKPENEDSHHRIGYLKWKGTPSWDGITLVLKDIDNIPSRKFVWTKDVLAEIELTN